MWFNLIIYKQQKLQQLYTSYVKHKTDGKHMPLSKHYSYLSVQLTNSFLLVLKINKSTRESPIVTSDERVKSRPRFKFPIKNQGGFHDGRSSYQQQVGLDWSVGRTLFLRFAFLIDRCFDVTHFSWLWVYRFLVLLFVQ